MRINNNITAINAHRQYGINNLNIGKNVEKLSSGFRVNRAADDAAGLAISEKMRSQIRGLNMASKNSQDAVSLVQTAEGGMQAIQNILQRVRELSVQSASDTNQNTVDRQAIQLEVNQLIKEIDQIADTTEFNKMKLLNGSGALLAGGSTIPSVFGSTAPGSPGFGTIQAGANSGQTMTISINDMTATGLGVATLFNSANEALNPSGPPANIGAGVASQTAAAVAISVVDNALNKVSLERAKLGAYQNRLEYKIANLDNQAENVAASESRIRDADMAKMMTEFTRNSILFQASTAMLAQANALPQGVLQLLG